MSNKVKNIGRKISHTTFLMILSIEKTFDPNNIKIDEKAYKNIFLYYIRYVTIRDSKCAKINSVNSLYLIFSKMNGYFEEINKNKYLMLNPTNESKEKKLKI